MQLGKACKRRRAIHGRLGLPASLACIFALACGSNDAPGASATSEEEASATANDSANATGAEGSEAGSQDGEAESTATTLSESSTTGASCEAISEALDAQAEGEFVAQGSSITAAREHCKAALHASAGSAGSTLSVELVTYDGANVDDTRMRVRAETLLGDPLSSWALMTPNDTLDVTLAQSGEFFIRLEPEAPDAETDDYELAVSCRTGCELEFTRYPTLFMHGMAGTEAYLDVLDYWFQVEDYVSTPGFLVVIRAVDAFSSTLVRSDQWAVHIDTLVAQGVGRRFNLIAHSQGGLDARRYASILDSDQRVASITTIATPHQGTAVADLTVGAFDAFPVDPATVNGVVEVLAGLVGLSGPDLVGQLEDLSTESMAQFNEDTPDVAGVYYSSWSGKSCATTDWLCQAGNNGEVIDPLFAATHNFMRLAEGDNDGVTGVESCKWGDWQGSVSADHMDEVGQIADFFNNAFDHKEFYLSELRRLAAMGL